MIGRIGNDKIGILLVTVPKSGTHLMIEIMQQTFGSYFTYRGGWGDKPENSIEWLNEVLFSGKDDRLLTTMKRTRAMAPNHTNNTGYAVLEKAIKENDKFRGIFMFRDPRDLVISMVKSTTKHIWPEGHLEEHMEKLADDESRFNWMMEKYGVAKDLNFKSILAGYSKFYHSEHFLNVRYEDLMGLRRGGNKWVLGKIIDSLAELTSCSSAEMAHGILDALGRSNWTRREDGARSSQWKEFFTESNIEIAKKVLGQQLINWEYEKDLEW